jgi:hypothetical protein
MLNLCGIVVAILKMATGRNFSMLGINSGHHFLTFETDQFLFLALADDHVNNVNYFPFMSIKKVIPYFCALREGYYVIIWLIVRICVFIKD